MTYYLFNAETKTVGLAIASTVTLPTVEVISSPEGVAIVLATTDSAPDTMLRGLPLTAIV